MAGQKAEMSSRVRGVPHDHHEPCCGRHRHLLASAPEREPSLPVLYYSARSKGRVKISSLQTFPGKIVRHKGRTMGVLAFCRFIAAANNSTFPWPGGEENTLARPPRRKSIKAFQGFESCPKFQLVPTGTGHKICLVNAACGSARAIIRN